MLKEKGIINGFKASGDGPSVTHLPFEDDTIYFVDLAKEQIENLHMILKIYECISGLKVNISKSCLAGVGVKDEELSIHANYIGCNVAD